MIQQESLHKNEGDENKGDSPPSSMLPNEKSYGYVIEAWSRQQSSYKRFLEVINTLESSQSTIQVENCCSTNDWWWWRRFKFESG